MKQYDVLITWIEWKRRGYIQKSKWERKITALNLTDASKQALSRHTNRIYPAVCMAWLCWP